MQPTTQTYSLTRSLEEQPQVSQPVTPLDDLGRTFNTALVNELGRDPRLGGPSIESVMASQAFHSILSSVRHLARSQGVSEARASEEIVRSFRALEASWRDFVFQQGLEQLRS